MDDDECDGHSGAAALRFHDPVEAEAMPQFAQAVTAEPLAKPPRAPIIAVHTAIAFEHSISRFAWRWELEHSGP
jgi:hypothetical protein